MNSISTWLIVDHPVYMTTKNRAKWKRLSWLYASTKVKIQPIPIRILAESNNMNKKISPPFYEQKLKYEKYALHKLMKENEYISSRLSLCASAISR